MARRKKRRRKRRTKARHFGDDPKIRHSRGEHTSFNINQPWERHYRGVKKSRTRVRAHYRMVKGRRVRIKGHIRKFKRR